MYMVTAQLGYGKVTIHARVPGMSRRVLRGFRPEKVVELREIAGFTRGDLARLVDVSSGAVAKWETGRSTPSVDTLARVAALLHTTVEAFIDIPADERFLGDLRALAGLTQPQLAAETGYSSSTIAQLEKGQARLTPSQAGRIAAAIDSTVPDVQAAYARTRSRPPGTRS